MKNEKNQNNSILSGIVLLGVLCIVFLIVYKAQLEEKLDAPVYCTLMSEHKTNSTVSMSEDLPVITENFICKVPQLREIRVECKGKKIDADAILVMILTDADTGEAYYYKEKKISQIISNGKKTKVAMKLKKPLSDVEGKSLILSWKLVDAKETQIQLTANCKPGIVFSFNGVQEDKSNVIYAIKYSDCGELKILYGILCVAMLFFGGIGYWLLIIRKMPVEQFYVPVALALGLIFQVIITVHGVPDEPWHIDTAYKYSNKMLFVEETGVPGTIYKRQCDIEMGDMLANGLESNSYYQLLHHTFEKPERTELVSVNYVDSSNLVPGVIFFPTALGISIGRIFGLSAMITLQLGRVFNLLAFILLTWCAIRTIPYGKNVIGMLGVLPIAMQQGASASYDAMINGIMFLFIALCFKLSESKHRKKYELFTVLILAVLITVVKGGVYLPAVLLLFLLYRKKELLNDTKKSVRKRIIITLGGGMILFVALLAKYLPVFLSLFTENTATKGADRLYNLQDVIKHPLKIIYLYWNTLMESGDNHIRGLLGGMLSWLDVRINWFFIVILLIGLLLLVNVEEDRYVGNRKQRLLMAAASGISIALIMLSMLFACTTMDADHILGLQGRYYLALAPMLFFLTSNQMVYVKKKQCSWIWMVVLVTEILIGVQVVAMVL